MSYARLLLIIKLIFIGSEFEFPEEVSCSYDGSTNLQERQDLVNTFQNESKTKHLIHPKIIVKTIRLIGTGINLTWAWQINIVDLEYRLYVEEQAERKITRIRQINYITIDFLVYYDVKIKRSI